MNALTFNNKKLVLNTWLQIKNGKTPTLYNLETSTINDKIFEGVKSKSLMNINLLSNDPNHYPVKTKTKKSNEKEITV